MLGTDPDMVALTLTVGFARQLIEGQAERADWQALTEALVENHTPQQLANMLTGAATLLAKAAVRR